MTTYTVNTKNGPRSVDSNLSDRDALTILSTTNTGFANDLVAKAQTPKGLSSVQWAWVHVLAVEATAPKPSVSVGNLDGLVKLLESAKASGLKYPKIRLMLPEIDLAVNLSVGRNGSIRIQGDDFVWNDRFGKMMPTYYGAVEGDDYNPSSYSPLETRSPIRAMLRKLSADPVGTAREYGNLTGKCCFCGRPLEDARSTESGYGPVCAKKFGLEWGTGEMVAVKKAAPKSKPPVDANSASLASAVIGYAKRFDSRNYAS